MLVTLPPAAPEVTLTVGQVIRLIPPQDAAGWNISYSGDILAMLTAADRLDRPGDTGWQLRAMRPGQTDVMVTSRPEPCSTNQPCSPPVMQFTLSVIVRT
ncbi:hypothetical protein K2Z83_18985 [Oscillochloris sp. ZM17-4]|uniref:hypothetical protein n=1 Tax=Oscillochloris sp. ZM17-4 TaxID=2866714 RepID=UPI001C73C724|nr:hypothetical protein [Oscillochloris sp. ZM17-4]MBX0329759.1 hypothetical protein [Oscillochloris sp. ZM17-4]